MLQVFSVKARHGLPGMDGIPQPGPPMPGGLGRDLMKLPESGICGLNGLVWISMCKHNKGH